MTSEAWEAEWRACFERLRARGYDLLAAQRTAREITTAKYGPQPSKPLWLSLGLAYIRGKMASIGAVEVDPMVQRVVVAVVYGIGAVGATLSAALTDGAISGQEWYAILGAFAVAAWGKFSSNTTVIAPSRAVWTAEERAAK